MTPSSVTKDVESGPFPYGSATWAALESLSRASPDPLLSAQELQILTQALNDEAGSDKDISEALRVVQSKLVYLSYGAGVSFQETVTKALSHLRDKPEPSSIKSKNSEEVVKSLLEQISKSESFSEVSEKSPASLSLLAEKIAEKLALLEFKGLLDQSSDLSNTLNSLAFTELITNEFSLQELNSDLLDSDALELLSLGVVEDEDGQSFVEFLLNQTIEKANKDLFESFGYSFLELLRALAKDLAEGSQPGKAISKFVENLDEAIETAWLEFSQVFEKGLLSVTSALRLGDAYGGGGFAAINATGLINAMSKNIGLPGHEIYSPVLNEINELGQRVSQAIDAAGFGVSSAFYSAEFERAISNFFKPSLDPAEKAQALQDMLAADQRIELDINLGVLGTLRIKNSTQEGNTEKVVSEFLENPLEQELPIELGNLDPLFEQTSDELLGPEALQARVLDELFFSNDGFDGDLQNLSLADSSVGGALFEVLESIGSANSALFETSRAVSAVLSSEKTSIEFESLSADRIREMAGEFEKALKDVFKSGLSPQEMGEKILKTALSGSLLSETKSVTQPSEAINNKFGFDGGMLNDAQSGVDLS